MNESTVKMRKFSFVDLLRYKSLRSMTLILIIVDGVFTLQYYTPTLMLNQFNLGIYLSGASIESAQVFAGILGYLIISKVKRRKEGMISFSIIAICSLTLIFIWDQNQTDVTDIGSNLIVLFFVFFIELTVSNAFNIYAIYLNELFPTQVRIIGVGFVKTFGTIVLLFSSQIINACLNSGFKIMILFTALAVLSAYLSFVLPETHGMRPPEIIEELNIQGDV